MGWNSPENAHAILERSGVPETNLERLSRSSETFKNHPDSVAVALRSDPRAPEVASSILGKDRASKIAQNTPEPTPDKLSDDQLVREVQSDIYQALGIDVKTDSNGSIKKFAKGVIDGLVVENAELAMQIKNEGIEKFLSQVRDQITSLE
jgi:hypothetical protein